MLKSCNLPLASKISAMTYASEGPDSDKKKEGDQHEN
jgi:hypothetical protein